MKYVGKWLLCIVLSLTVLLCSGCSRSTEVPPYYLELCNLLGQSKGDVIAALNINEKDLEYAAGGFYKTPLKVQYCDVSFDLWIGIEETQDMLTCFYYNTEYSKAQETQAAEDAVRIAAQMDQFMQQEKGEAFSAELNEAQLHEKTEQEIRTLLENPDGYNGHDCWEFRSITNEAIREAIAKFSELDPSLTRFTPGFYCTHHLVSDKETERLLQTLAFEITMNKGNR